MYEEMMVTILSPAAFVVTTGDAARVATVFG
jgi:hypothetical protein